MKTLAMALLICSLLPAQQRPAAPWRATLADRLPYYGHRNWIVIADSAYPLQSAPGIETILSDESQVETVRQVLTVLAGAKHVRPIVYTDKELGSVPEQDAVGVTAYRQLLSGVFEKFLPDQKVQSTLHDQVIHQLDEAAKTFHVLIVKTNMTIPYTSVFIELRAAYWGDDAEQRLRQSMQ
jgi:hypothetical protein